MKRREFVAFSLSVWTTWIALSFCTPADAVVGQVDTEDKFPYVVQLEIEFYGNKNYLCSGSVSRAGLVSTAAHCIWDPGAGLAKQVFIKYRDADGQSRRVREDKIFYPKAFEEAMTKWDKAMKGSPPPGFDVMEAQKLDIAFIVPAEFVEVEGFPHWGTELLQSEQCSISADELVKYGDRPPPRCAGQFSREKFDRELGDLRHVRALAVGFGDYECKSFDDRDYRPDGGCRSDGRRRYAEVPLIPEPVSGSAPEVWCTGQIERNGDKINPVQHGDSGGPRFIRALDGRWLFVGYTSGGNNSGDCASSIFQHLDLWREAALYRSRIRYKPNSGANNWNRHQMHRFVEEVLESWSSPNEEALRRVSSFYRNEGSDVVESEDLTKMLATKKRFAEKWPVRHFVIQAGTEIEVEEDSTGDPIDSVNATISWAAEDSGGATTSGTARLDLVVRYNFDNELKLAYGSPATGPIIQDEKCRMLSGDLPPTEMGCPKFAPNVWAHNGSTVTLAAEGSKRRFLYEAPRNQLLALGVQKGTLLFEGSSRGKTYEGTAYIFNRTCGKQGYRVTGPVSDDYRSVTLRGQSPRVDSACNVVGYRNDVLVFTFEGD
jgi:hypothetical protein